jgi:hypothetical protein
MEVDYNQRTVTHTSLKKLPWSVLPYPDYETLTIQHLFRENARRFKERQHLGFRPYDKETKKWVRCFVYYIN